MKNIIGPGAKLNSIIDLKIVEGDLGSGQFFISSDFDGQIVEQFIDTGSTFTSLPWNIFSDYSTVGASSSKGLANNSVQHDKISIQKVLIGNHTLNLFEVIRLKEQSLMQPTLGVNAFQKVEFIFDSRLKELTFMKSDLNKVTSSPLEIGKREHILLNTIVDKHSYTAIWDTGAGLTTVDENLIKNSPENFTFLQETEGDDCNENNLKLKLYKAKSITVGNLEFSDLDVLAHDFQPISQALGEKIDLALGFNAIVQKKWSFNLHEKLWNAE